MKFKTLKDMHHFSIHELRDDGCIGVALQTRTKKAGKKGYGCKVDINPLFVHANLLRQEAIKWIKYVRKNCVYACRLGKITCIEHKFWMERFNLTEDDLK